MFQLTRPSVYLRFVYVPFFLHGRTSFNTQSDTFDDVSTKSAWGQVFIVAHLQSSRNHQVITAICKFRADGGNRLGWEWIRMAAQVAQLLLKGLFITVRSLLAPSALLSPSSVFTGPHLNNGPNTKKHVVCVWGCVCLGGVGLHVPLIFRSASLLIKAAITT